LKYEPSKSVVEVWDWRDSEGVLNGLFELSQIEGIFEGEIIGDSGVAPANEALEDVGREKENTVPDALAASIKSLGLQYRILRSLLKESSQCSRIATVGDLIGQTAEELLERPNFGAGALSEVRAALARIDLKLAGDP